MPKYEPLTVFLKKQSQRVIPMRFAEVERVLGAKLPRSAHDHRPWWANEANGHVHAKAWLDAGYRTEQVDMAGKKLVFRRVAGAEQKSAGGMQETGRMYKQEEGKELPPHPAVGSMKGMFTIAPGVDLTQPVYSEEEWNEIMGEWERNWDALGFKKD